MKWSLSKPIEWLWITFSIVVSLGASAWADPEAAAAELIKTTLRVGFSNCSFSNINRTDAEAAFKMFTVNVGRERGYDMIAQTEVFDDVAVLAKAIEQGGLHLIIVSTWEYLSLDLQNYIEPVYVPCEDKEIVMKDNLVLTQREKGMKTLTDLQGKSVLLLSKANTTMTKHWLDTLLLENGLGTSGTFFGSIKETYKVTSVILPVFFGSADACVVDRSAFDTMKELNPQIGARLQIMAKSPPFLDSVICVSKAGWDPPDSSLEYRQDLIKALGDLHKELAGQQILTLFKVNQMVPFQDEYLDSVRQLYKNFLQLTRKPSEPGPKKIVRSVPAAPSGKKSKTR